MNGLRITFCSDLKNGRRSHSLVHLLSLYSVAELNYVSPPSLGLPREIFDEMERKGVPQKVELAIQLTNKQLTPPSQRSTLIWMMLSSVQMCCMLLEFRRKGLPRKKNTARSASSKLKLLATHRVFTCFPPKVKGSYVVTPESLSKAKDNVIVMHPLPRIDEISTELDSDPRAAYFRQMENGMYIRMALLAIVRSEACIV